VGNELTRRAGLADRVDIVQGDATDLPFPPGSFDVAWTQHAAMNIADKAGLYRELRRVVKPGGRVIVLEFGQPRGAFGAVFRAYSRGVMPLVGGLLTGNRAAYEYLPRTAAAFPAGEKFLGLMREAGVFSRVDAHPLTFATAYVYRGVK